MERLTRDTLRDMTTSADDPTASVPAPDAPRSVPESWGEPRTKTVEWYDPLAAAQSAAGLSGREHLEKMLAGELPPPPISQLLGFGVVAFGDGEATFEGVPDESVYNPIGLVHGGVVCTLLDSVIGCAVQTQLPAGVGYTSIDISISYLRPIHHDTGRITAIGRVTKPGRRVSFAEGRVLDANGKVLATATGSCLIIGPS